ncbi:MAG TPA: PilZ domain-containing protein [Rhodanobacteraceae bacterium]|nr:PilZ domain-containing protein [Rhodanobacteraceae bacterium]
MAHEAWQSFLDRIAWEGSVHVACERLDAPLDPARRANLDELNTGVLATLGLLGERSGGEAPDDDAAAATLARIDAKVDALLEMFNRHLAASMQMPPRRAVRFNQRGILVEHWQPGTGEDAVLVRMHFDACMGLPLELPGRAAAAPDGRGGFVAFDELADGIREGIEHLVFRQHRRQVAEARRESLSGR